MAQFKKPPLLFTVGTAVLLVVGGAIAYWGLQWRTAGGRGLPAGIKAVPETATAVASLSTNGEQWQKLRQFGTVATQAAFDQQLANWRDRWLASYDVSFDRDISPWVGPEATLAWIPTVAGGGEGREAEDLSRQQRVLLLPIADAQAAQAMAGTWTALETAPQVDYRGVTLRSIAMTSDPSEAPDAPLWLAVLGNQLVLIAETETAAQQAIDTYRGGKSLAEVPGYRRSLEHIEIAQPFGKIYLNTPAAIQRWSETAQPPLPPGLVDRFQDSQGVAFTATLTSQGIQLRGTSWLGASSDRSYQETNVAAQLPQFLPRDTLMMASGGNFQQLWQDLKQQGTWSALTALEPENLASAFQNSTGLALETDLLPWLADEFALALVPPPDPSSEEDSTPLPNPGLVVLAQVSNRPQAEQTFARLDTVVKNRYRFSILKEPLGQLELVKWVSPFQAVTFSRGWLDASIAFLTVGTDVEDTIVPKPRRSLATAPLFQLTTADAPYPNNGHFFLNLEAIGLEENALFLPPLPVESQGALRAVQAIGVTATVVDRQRLRYDLYVALKRGNRPGPLPRPATAE